MIPGLHWWSRILLGGFSVPAFYLLSVWTRALAVRLSRQNLMPAFFWFFLADFFLFCLFAAPFYIWVIDPVIAHSRRRQSASVVLHNGVFHRVAGRSRSALATDVGFDAAMMHVLLTDGRRISVPLESLSRLRDATEEQRQNWRLIGGGVGIHWQDLDVDLSVAGLLAH